MLICSEPQFMFVHIQRTGGTAIESALLRDFFPHTTSLPQHENMQTITTQLLHETQDYFKFAVVRNPWDRIASWYRFFHQHNPVNNLSVQAHFKHFVQQELPKQTPHFFFNQLDYISLTPSKHEMDYLIRFENFEKDLANVSKKLGLPPTSFPKINQNKKNDYKLLYDQESIKFIAESCKRDIDFFNYSYPYK